MSENLINLKVVLLGDYKAGNFYIIQSFLEQYSIVDPEKKEDDINFDEDKNDIEKEKKKKKKII